MRSKPAARSPSILLTVSNRSPPALVRRTPEPLRKNNRCSTRSSSLRICWLTADWVSASSSAASEKLPSRPADSNAISVLIGGSDRTSSLAILIPPARPLIGFAEPWCHTSRHATDPNEGNCRSQRDLSSGYRLRSRQRNSMSDITTHGDGAITRVTSKGYSKENTFAGVLSFLRRRYSKDLAGADVVVSGIPLDLATTNRPGTRLGPGGIRAASVDLNWPIYPWGFGPCDRLSIIDYGDCWFDPHRPDLVFESIVQHARTILASGATMLTLGGDHYVTYPLLHAHAEKFGQPLSIIHF